MNPPSDNFKVYQASAGAGKTYTIIKEYLSLCLKSKKDTSNFSQILAITFTNMAANEMKAKIIKHLDSIIHSDPTQAPEDMEADLIKELHIERNELKTNAELLFQKIIHDYSSFCVSTIDAFVQKLSRSFAKELGLPSQFNVSIDTDEVADDITERIGEQIGKDNPFLTKILEDFSEMKFDEEKSPKIKINIHDFIIKLFAEEAFLKNEQNHFREDDAYKETLNYLNGKIHAFEAKCNQFIPVFKNFIHNNNLTEDDFNYKAKGPCLSLLINLKEGKYSSLGDRQLQVIDGSLNWYSKNLAKKANLNSIDADFQQVFVNFLKEYQKQIVKNAKALAQGLLSEGFDLVSGGTDNHLMLVDLRPLGLTGKETETNLNNLRITVNKNAIPGDPQKPSITSGIRVGTPSVTTRGLVEEDMRTLSHLMKLAAVEPEAKKEEVLAGVAALCAKYPLYRE